MGYLLIDSDFSSHKVASGQVVIYSVISRATGDK